MKFEILKCGNGWGLIRTNKRERFMYREVRAFWSDLIVGSKLLWRKVDSAKHPKTLLLSEVISNRGINRNIVAGRGIRIHGAGTKGFITANSSTNCLIPLHYLKAQNVIKSAKTNGEVLEVLKHYGYTERETITKYARTDFLEWELASSEFCSVNSKV